MRILFFFLCIQLSFSVEAQQALSARAMAVGEAGVAFKDINSIFYNQAGLYQLQGANAVLSAESRFSLAELGTYSGGFVYGANQNVFGLSVHYFGFDAFKRQRVGLVYARKILSNLSIGAEVNYHNFQIPEYGNKGIFSFELGAQYEISKQVIIGAQVANPIQQAIVEGQNLQTRIRFGGTYLPSDKVSLHAAFDKELDTQAQFRAGLEYQLIPILCLRLGVSTAPSLVHAGIGIQLKNGLTLDATFSYHQQLGVSPSLGIVYTPTQED